jgi:hypothetical protein
MVSHQLEATQFRIFSGVNCLLLEALRKALV